MSLLLAIWLAATPFELPDTEQPWARIVTTHFDIISSSGDRRTRDLARDLETLAAALADIRPAATPTTHTRVFVFARRREVQPYFDLLMHREKADVSGAFVAQSNRATMFIDDSRRISDRTPYHELVHYLMGNSPQRAPLWVEEGLAEYYSSAEVHGGIIRVGAQIHEHIERLKRGKLIPVSEVFTTTDSIAQTFYAESWAIVDWMINRDRHAFDAFLRDVMSGTPSDVALQKYFHKTPGDIEFLITSLPQLTMTLQVRVPEVTADATRVNRADLLFELGHFLTTIDGARDAANQYFRAAVEANPKHARAFAALGEFEKAVGADPNDGEVVLEYAESLQDFHRARDLANKAIELGADRTRALAVLNASWAAEVRAELPQINALVKGGNLEEAAGRTRALAAIALDSAARLDLEAQAKQLENDAASNREIAKYNEAVELFNGGDYKSAKKIVDELLKNARNEQVVADASKLKIALEKLLKK